MSAQWFVLVNDQGLILAVYGSALRDDAMAKLEELCRLGPVALRVLSTSKRPRVGTTAP